MSEIDGKRLMEIGMKSTEQYTAGDFLYLLKVLPILQAEGQDGKIFFDALSEKFEELQALSTYPKLLLQAYLHPENVPVATENQNPLSLDPYPQRLVPLPGVIAAYLENNKKNPSAMISQLGKDFRNICINYTLTPAKQSFETFETFLGLLEVAIGEAVEHPFTPEQMKSLVKGADIFEAEFRREKEGYVTDYTTLIERAFDDYPENVQLLMAARITKAMAGHLSEIEGYDGDKLQAVQANAVTLIESVNSRQGGTTR